MKEIAGIYGISHWTIQERLAKAGVKKNIRRAVGNNDVFDGFSEASCYWAGFIAADGWIVGKTNKYVAIELNAKDSEHLVKLSNLAQREASLYRRSRLRSGKMIEYARLSLGSRKIADDLRVNFNIVPAKSRILSPPSKIPSNLIRHYIRGYIDGDGSIGWKKSDRKPRLSICSGSEDIIRWISKHIKEGSRHSGNTNVSKVKDANTYRVEYCGTYVEDILDWLYEESTPETRLDRKYGIYMENKERLKQYYADSPSIARPPKPVR
jgi:hypothetical protein